MSKTTLFYGAIVVAVLFFALAIYYAIPGIYHPFTLSPPTEWHPTHAAAFIIVSAICVVVALVNRRKTVR